VTIAYGIEAPVGRDVKPYSLAYWVLPRELFCRVRFRLIEFRSILFRQPFARWHHWFEQDCSSPD